MGRCRRAAARRPANARQWLRAMLPSALCERARLSGPFCLAQLPSLSCRPVQLPIGASREAVRGFSLIELMIVIGIIVDPGADRAARRSRQADPRPHRRIAQARRHRQAAGRGDAGPRPASCRSTTPRAGLPVADKIVNEYISSVAVESGAIQVTFGNHANVAIQGKVLTPAPRRGRGRARSFRCPGSAATPSRPQMTAKGLNKTDVPARYLPLTAAPATAASRRRDRVRRLRPRQREPALGRQGAAVARPDRRAQPHLALGDARSRRRATARRSRWPTTCRRRSPPSSTRRSGRSATSAGSRNTGSRRNVQRGRGERADPTQPRLASIVPEADALVRPGDGRPAARAASSRPARCPTCRRRAPTSSTRSRRRSSCSPASPSRTTPRSTSIASRSSTRRCTARRSRCWRRRSASTTGRPRARASRRAPPRPPLLFPATRWLLGSSGAGFRFDNEARAASGRRARVRDRRAGRSPGRSTASSSRTAATTSARTGATDGWAWLQREGRRTPRHVDQMRHGVLQRRFGVLARVAAQPAVHVSWHEADAWCRWAGRRLPSEVEWEAAAHQGATRGFRWGDVHEWTATTFRPYPGFVAGPWRDYSLPAFGVTQGAARRLVRDPAEPAQRPPARLRAGRARRRLLRLSQLRRIAAAPRFWRQPPH